MITKPFMKKLLSIFSLCLLFNVTKAQQSSFIYHIEGCASERINKSGESKFQEPATNWPSLDTNYIKGDTLFQKDLIVKEQNIYSSLLH